MVNKSKKNCPVDGFVGGMLRVDAILSIYMQILSILNVTCHFSS